MKKVTRASLIIEVNVRCPHCDTPIDLLDEKETNDCDHNEEGHVVSQACPDGSWIDEHEAFEVEDVTCGQCKKSFDVRGIDW